MKPVYYEIRARPVQQAIKAIKGYPVWMKVHHKMLSEVWRQGEDVTRNIEAQLIKSCGQGPLIR